MDANWYPDPSTPGSLRYWDGQAWTEHTAPDPTATQGQGDPAAAGTAAPAAPTPGARPHMAGVPAGLAASTLFTDNMEAATTGRMTRQNPAVVKATLSGLPLMVTRGAMIAYQGEITFAYQGSGGMGKYLKAAATGEGMKLMRCEGTGELFVSRGGHKLHLLDLAQGEQLSASSRALLGFDSSISYDIKMIKGGIGAMAAGGLFNITLTGPGTVILATDWPVVLDTSEAKTLVDPNAVGRLDRWSDRDAAFVDVGGLAHRARLGRGDATRVLTRRLRDRRARTTDGRRRRLISTGSRRLIDAAQADQRQPAADPLEGTDDQRARPRSSASAASSSHASSAASRCALSSASRAANSDNRT